MQRRLSEAAYEVIREVGYANFRTSAASKRAGVSQGAQLHHYPTKNSIAIAALEHAYGKAYEQFEKNLDSVGDEAELHAELTEVSRQLRDKVERHWLEQLVDDGWSLTLAKDALALSHSMVRGFATGALLRNDRTEFDRLLKRRRRMALPLREQQS